MPSRPTLPLRAQGVHKTRKCAVGPSRLNHDEKPIVVEGRNGPNQDEKAGYTHVKPKSNEQLKITWELNYR